MPGTERRTLGESVADKLRFCRRSNAAAYATQRPCGRNALYVRCDHSALGFLKGPRNAVRFDAHGCAQSLLATDLLMHLNEQNCTLQMLA